MDQPIPRAVLRDAMLESLRLQAPGQFLTLKMNTAHVLSARGLPVIGGGHGQSELRRIDDRRFREILWSLINSGVLVQGTDSANAQWPFLSLTEAGEQFVKEGRVDVYDPDGYLRQLAAEFPLDEIEKRFAGQAIGAFNANLPDAAAVMIGAAAEHVVELLCEAVGRADVSVLRATQRLENQPASKALTFASGYFEDRKSQLDRHLREHLATTFAGVASR